MFHPWEITTNIGLMDDRKEKNNYVVVDKQGGILRISP
jgi:hypothetical protein